MRQLTLYAAFVVAILLLPTILAIGSPSGELGHTAEAAPLSQPVPVNLLDNPSFELSTDGTQPDGWEIPSWALSSVTRSNTAALDGSYSMRFQSSTGPSFNVKQDVPATAGRSYDFSGWVFVPSASGYFTFALQLQAVSVGNGVLSTVSLGEPFKSTTSGWVPVTGQIALPPNGATVRVLMKVTNLKATVYVDQFSLVDSSAPTPTATPSSPTATPTPTPTPGANRLVNPGFEDGLLGWHRPPWFASVADVTTDVVHSGVRAFWFGKATSAYVSQDVAAVPGQTVTFSVWVNATYNAANWGHYGHVHMKLVALNSNKGTIATYPLRDAHDEYFLLPPAGGEWVQGSHTAVMPPGTAWARLLFDAYGLDGTVYLDDASVTISGP